jgi:hypothetical protein
VYTKNKVERRLVISRLSLSYEYLSYKPCGHKSYYQKDILKGCIDAYIDLDKAPILAGGKLLK